VRIGEWRYRLINKSMSESFKNLDIWKDSIELAETIYKISSKFPKSESFGLTSQIRRAVISISSNIAEGSHMRSKKDFSRFIVMARGSLSEVESQVILANRLEYIKNDDYKELIEDINVLGAKMGGFLKYLQK